MKKVSIKPQNAFLTLVSAPARRALQQAGIGSLKQLSTFSVQDILKLHGVGKTTIPILERELNNAGLCFKTSSEVDIFDPKDLTDWRKWLEENHLSKRAVWLVFYTAKSGRKSFTWSESVDVALCFGWIDSKQVKVDEETSHQFFSKRKAKSTWSKINKRKVNELIEKDLMTQAGLESIEIAKQNGSWTILDEVEELIVPPDLAKAFKSKPKAKEFFNGLSQSIKKAILQWLMLAKRPDTRQKRITELIEQAELQKKPKHLQAAKVRPG